MNYLSLIMVRIFLVGLVALIGGTAWAQNFPTKPVRFLVPYAPGGVGDLTARLVAQKMSENLGQPVVIENRPGAGMVTGTDLVAKAEPDGYTIGLTGNGHTLAQTLFKSLPYDISKDFTHVSTIGFFDLAFFVHPSSDINNVQALIRYAKANPGKVNIASISLGSTQHLAAELFKSMAGIEATVIPYRSSADVLTAVYSQTVTVAVEIIAPVLGQIRSNSVKPLAVTSSARFVGLPNVPTVIESGLPGYEAASWNGVSVPARTPTAVVNRLNAAVVFAVNTPAVKAKMLEMGVSSKSSSPQEMRDLITSDVGKWKAVIESAKIERQ